MTVDPDTARDESAASAIREEAAEYARQNRWVLNTDEKKLQVVLKGLARNERKFGHRYCPCRIRSGDEERDKEIICPCLWHRDEILQDGSCHCNLYYSK